MGQQKFLSMFWNFLCIVSIMFQGGGLQNTSKLEQVFHCLTACISLWQLKHVSFHRIQIQGSGRCLQQAEQVDLPVIYHRSMSKPHCLRNWGYRSSRGSSQELQLSLQQVPAISCLCSGLCSLQLPPALDLRPFQL